MMRGMAACSRPPMGRLRRVSRSYPRPDPMGYDTDGRRVSSGAFSMRWITG